MPTGGAVLGGDSREVRDVLGEDGVAGRYRCVEDLGVGAARQLERGDRAGFDSGGLCVGFRRRDASAR